MSRNYIDGMLAKLDGALAPLWCNVFVTINQLPDLNRLKKSFISLVEETPKLNVVWHPKTSNWRTKIHNKQSILEAFNYSETYISPLKICNNHCDLEKDVLIRITIVKENGYHSKSWIIAFQFHHAICDAKSFAKLHSRLWDIYNGQSKVSEPIDHLGLTNVNFILSYFSRLKFLFNHFNSSKRVLSKRAVSLSIDSLEIKESYFSTLKVPLRNISVNPARLFYAAIIYAISKNLEIKNSDGIIRLRIPVDLRKYFKKRNAIENALSVVPIEIPVKLVSNLRSNPKNLMKVVPNLIRQTILAGIHWTSLIETLIASKFSSKDQLKRRYNEDMTNSLRSATMVITFLGSLKQMVQNVPFQYNNVISHNPTWGANGYVHNNNLYINISSFRGIWSPQTLQSFLHHMNEWFSTCFDVEGELVNYDSYIEGHKTVF